MSAERIIRNLIHSKGKPIDKFETENNNIKMNYNVFKASFEAGVKRVIYASSNHAADWYENFLIHDRKMESIDPYLLPLSDNFYGWAKASSEHMSFLFACGIFGRKMDIVNVRIGSPKEIGPNEKDVRLLKRHLININVGRCVALCDTYEKNLKRALKIFKDKENNWKI